MRLLQLYIAWHNGNELKQDNQSYEDRYRKLEDILCNMKRHKPYMDIDYEELQIFSIDESDDEEDAAGFSMINLDLLHLDLEAIN